MSTKTKTLTKQTKKDALEGLRLPELWERFRETTGENSRSPNRKFLIRRIVEALEARARTPGSTEEEEARPVRRNATTPESTPTPAPATPTATISMPKPRGRFASMTIEELQTRYREVVGRDTGSSARDYLVWKIREAEKGRITVGPRKARARDGEPLDVKILPIRLEADVVERMDAAWRSRGIKNRMEFFRRAIGHYLAHLAADDVSARVERERARA